MNTSTFLQYGRMMLDGVVRRDTQLNIIGHL